MSRTYIPQELLYNISTYGRTVPGLTPGYIEQSVRNIDPNFNWSGEFLLEFYRANDEVYHQLLQALNRVPEGKYPELRAYTTSNGIEISVPIYGLSSRQIRDIARQPDIGMNEVMIIKQRPGTRSETYNGRSFKGMILQQIPGLVEQNISTGTYLDGPALVLSTVDVSDEDIDRYMKIVSNLNHYAEVINNRLAPSTDKNLVVYVPLEGQSDLNRVNAALYLLNPRSTPSRYNGTFNGETYIYTINIQQDGERNYPRLLNEASKDLLLQTAPNYFPRAIRERRLPEDSEIIQAILQLNPAYDLGELLQWLEMRRAICPDVRNSPLYELMKNSTLTSISNRDDQYRCEVFMYTYNKEQEEDILALLDRLGYGDLIYNILYMNQGIELVADPQGDPEGIARLRGLVTEFLLVRTCLMNYLPTFNGTE